MTFDLDLWPTDLTINRGHLLIKDYLPTKFEAYGAKRSWVISCTRWSRLAWPLTLTFDLTINRDHLLIKDYLPTKFEASRAKPSWVISCTRLRDTDRQTYRPTDRHTDRHVQSNMPLLFQRGGIISLYPVHKVLYTECQSWPWPLNPWPKIKRVPPHVIYNLNVKFESDRAKTVVCILSTRQSATDTSTNPNTHERPQCPLQWCISCSQAYFQTCPLWPWPLTSDLQNQ